MPTIRKILKVRILNLDDPFCSLCGRRLLSTTHFWDSIAERGGRVFVSSDRPADVVREDYKLYRGTVCFDCKEVVCLNCLEGHGRFEIGRLEKCFKCEGDTKPAYHGHLRQLISLAEQSK